MSAVLYDAPGPRTRALTLVGSTVAGIGLLGGAYWVGRRLYDRGQFEAYMWEPFTNPDIQRTVFSGWVSTLQAAGLAIACSLVLGGVLAAGRLSDHRWIRIPSTTLIEGARSIPLLLLILALFIAFPQALGSLGALVLGLTLYNGSVLAELFRAGIQALPRGQAEAAYALGMRKTQVMTLILLPQAVRSMLPALVSQCVVTLKDTALGYIITYGELLTVGKSIYLSFFNIIPTMIVVATIYIGTNMAVSAVAHWLQRRGSKKTKASKTVTTGLVDGGQTVVVGNPAAV